MAAHPRAIKDSWHGYPFGELTCPYFQFAAWKSRVARHSVGLAWSLWRERITMQRPIMRRWHEEYPRTFREWRKHYLSHVESNIYWNRGVGADPYQVDCVCDQQKGLFRKRRALSCGRARCRLCHGYKYPKREATRGEMLSEVKLNEGIDEFMLPEVDSVGSSPAVGVARAYGPNRHRSPRTISVAMPCELTLVAMRRNSPSRECGCATAL
jgi:hypothetical protein